jgi:hypothetical protein
VLLNDGNDVMGWSNHDVAVGGLFSIDLHAGAGNDLVQAVAQPLVLAGGEYRLRLAGDDGNDELLARLQPDPASRGRIVAELFGGAGNDLLELLVTGSTNPSNGFQGLVDGGDGYDSSHVSRRVRVRHCEEVFFLD